MYYSHSCSYCSKIFYTFNDNKQHAAETLYHGIRQHLVDFNEDHKEFQFDDGESMDIHEIYSAAFESNEAPPGGYEL